MFQARKYHSSLKRLVKQLVRDLRNYEDVGGTGLTHGLQGDPHLPDWGVVSTVGP
ncbi:MAG: hypothetical protein J4G19_08795 [Pseudomonadales bacterium]|nr:hypothetical protein [Pseudomonadales bacterium]